MKCLARFDRSTMAWRETWEEAHRDATYVSFGNLSTAVQYSFAKFSYYPEMFLGIRSCVLIIAVCALGDGVIVRVCSWMEGMVS